MKCSELYHEVTVKPDGIHELDPCEYEVQERYTNVTVEFLRCKNCGNPEIIWYKQPNTEREI